MINDIVLEDRASVKEHLVPQDEKFFLRKSMLNGRAEQPSNKGWTSHKLSSQLRRVQVALNKKRVLTIYYAPV